MMSASVARSQLFYCAGSRHLPVAFLRARRLLSSSGRIGDGKTTRRNRIVAQTIMYLRIPALVAGVFGLGYQMGVMDTISDPAKKEKAIMNSVLMSAGCSDPSKEGTRMAKDGAWSKLHAAAVTQDPQLLRVVSVGERIVHVAQKMAEREKAEIESKIIAEIPVEIASDEKNVQAILEAEKRLDARAAAADVMDGEWTYVLLDSPAPNAFVTQILPRKIFVTTAMMDKFIENDDEMALVLGHEVSHLILGHVGYRTIVEAILSTLEIVILTTLNAAAGGLGSVNAIIYLATVKRWASNAYSRENESAADEMGIKLAAMACFDTKRGVEVFRKMQSMDPPGTSFLTIELDHPPTEERFEYLLKASDEENVAKYEGSFCADVRTKFRNAMNNLM